MLVIIVFFLKSKKLMLPFFALTKISICFDPE